MFAKASVLCLVVLIPLGSAWKSSDPQTGDKKKADPGEVEMTFANGSVVRMKLLPNDIEIMTEFGKLQVPVQKIRSIEFGLHLPEGMDKTIDAAVKQLASPAFKERQEAINELAALGANAYPSLLQAAKSSDPEMSKNASDALAKIRAKLPAKDLQISAEDRIVTSRFTIVGRIITASIKAKSDYFADVDHAVTNLRSLRVMGSSHDTEVVVDAGKFGMNDQWLDTGITIESALTVVITASGDVDLRPSMPGTMVTGPQGYVEGIGRGGMVPGGGGPGGLGKKRKGGPDMRRAYPGTLLGRIGPNGDAFVIGERFEGIAEQNGKLYLQIAANPYDVASLGSYAVKVSVRE